jgi:hypothetical protein
VVDSLVIMGKANFGDEKVFIFSKPESGRISKENVGIATRYQKKLPWMNKGLKGF